MSDAVTQVSVIMPTLNEAGNIAALIRRTACALEGAGFGDFEIIVVDDNSADRTWEIAGQANDLGGKLKVIRRRTNHGLTASICEGIDATRFEVIVWMDCDFSHPPERIPQLLYMLGQGFDVAVNSRYTTGGGEDRVGKGGYLQRVLSWVLNWSVRFLLHPSFSDWTSGFIAVRRGVLEAVPLRGDYGEYFIDFIFRVMHRKFRVCELPYFALPRQSGESKTGTNLMQYVARGRKYFSTVFRLRIDSMIGWL